MLLLTAYIEKKLLLVKEIKENCLKPALYNCHHLLTMINDILDFTKEEFGEE
jgi:hypothetical protein